MSKNQNFEEKHPRDINGRFAEKRHAESGLVLNKPDNGCPTPDSQNMSPRDNAPGLESPKPNTDIDGYPEKPEPPMVGCSKWASLRSSWKMVKCRAQSFTFAVFLAVVTLVLSIGLFIFLMEKDSNKNDTQIPEVTNNAATTTTAISGESTFFEGYPALYGGVLCAHER